MRRTYYTLTGLVALLAFGIAKAESGLGREQYYVPNYNPAEEPLKHSSIHTLIPRPCFSAGDLRFTLNLKRPSFGDFQVRHPLELQKGFVYQICKRGHYFPTALIEVIEAPNENKGEWGVTVFYKEKNGSLERKILNNVFLMRLGLLPYQGNLWEFHQWLEIAYMRP